MKVTRERCQTIISGFEGRRIVVLGDIMLDEFVWGRVRRISPEAPVPVVEIQSQTLAIGGAGNVVANVIGLGADAFPVGVIGDDLDAKRLESELLALGVPSSGLIRDPSRPTTLKTRIVAHNQQMVRADREDRSAVSGEVEARVLDAFLQAIDNCDAVIVSDYNKGLLTARLLSETLKTARARDLIMCLDPKTRNFSNYQPVTVITPNNQELGEAAGLLIETKAELEMAGRKVLASIDCKAVLVTRGEEGMTLFTGHDEVTHIPTVAREVYDVTGAGDTVIATMTLALTAGASPVEAAFLANHAAGVVVGKIGTAPVRRDELLDTVTLSRP